MKVFLIIISILCGITSFFAIQYSTPIAISFFIGQYYFLFLERSSNQIELMELKEALEVYNESQEIENSTDIDKVINLDKVAPSFKYKELYIVNDANIEQGLILNWLDKYYGNYIDNLDNHSFKDVIIDIHMYEPKIYFIKA